MLCKTLAGLTLVVSLLVAGGTVSSLLVGHGLPKCWELWNYILYRKLKVEDGVGERWAPGRSAVNWMSGTFPASSFTLFFSLHPSGPKSSLKGNSIKPAQWCLSLGGEGVV